MDKGPMKGKIMDVSGRIKRQAAEWAGSQKAQIAGAAQQARGKSPIAWGKANDAGRAAVERTQQQNERVNRLKLDRKKEKRAA